MIGNIGVYYECDTSGDVPYNDSPESIREVYSLATRHGNARRFRSVCSSGTACCTVQQPAVAALRQTRTSSHVLWSVHIPTFWRNQCVYTLRMEEADSW